MLEEMKAKFLTIEKLKVIRVKLFIYCCYLREKFRIKVKRVNENLESFEKVSCYITYTTPTLIPFHRCCARIFQ